MGLFRGIMRYLVLDIFFLFLMMLMACAGVFLACHTPLESAGIVCLAILIMVILFVMAVGEKCFPLELMFDGFAFFLPSGIALILGFFVTPLIALPSFIVFFVMALALLVLLFTVMKIQDADLYFHYRYHGGLVSYFVVVQGCALLAFYYLSKACSFYPNVGEILGSGGVFAYVFQNQSAFFFALSFLLYAIVHLVYLSRMESCLFFLSFKERCSYPQDSRYIRKVASHFPLEEIRAVALGMLPYPEEKETLRQMALQDQGANIRKQALAKLPYSEEKELFRQIALQDQERYILKEVFSKFSYPEEGETLRQIALHGMDADARRQAIEKLPYPEEKEILRQIILQDEDVEVHAQVIEKLPYPEEKETIRQIALHETEVDVRFQALKKLPYPEEREAYLDAVVFFESFLREKQKQRYQQKVAKYLIWIYRVMHSKKNLRHIDILSRHNDFPHTDVGSYDCYDCNWGDDHADYGSHSDGAHDDYFRIETRARTSRSWMT